MGTKLGAAPPERGLRLRRKPPWKSGIFQGGAALREQHRGVRKQGFRRSAWCRL